MANLLSGTRIYGTANVDTGINIGLYAYGSANGGVFINATSVAVGNSTANTIMSSIRGPYASDSAAATGGVPLRNLYYDASGIIHIRLV